MNDDNDLPVYTTEPESELDPIPVDTTGVRFVMPAAPYDSVHTESDVLLPLLDSPSEEPPAPEVARFENDAITALGTRIDGRFDELKSLFEREIRAESTREKVVDRLHAELQEYKGDLLLSTLRPVFVDLIQLHDDIGKVAVSSSTDGEPPAEVQRLIGLMEGFQQGIEDILYRQGVEPFHVEGDAFDPRRQRAVSTVATDDAALNKTVAARHRKGFRAGERIIRPEIVSVYSLKK